MRYHDLPERQGQVQQEQVPQQVAHNRPEEVVGLPLLLLSHNPSPRLRHRRLPVRPSLSRNRLRPQRREPP